MKIKNINIFERYIERVFLGLAVLFAGAVVWFYFASSPYSVAEVGPERNIPPSRAEEVLGDAAKKLSAGLNAPSHSLPPMPVPNYTQDFQRRVNRSVANVNRYDVPLGQFGLDKTLVQPPPPPPLYEVPTPPPPRDPRPQANHFVLDDRQSEDVRQSYIALIGPQVPRDFWGVSVMATFDMDAWRQRVRSAPEKARIQDDLIRGSALITDVVLERETLDAATGSWGARVQISPLPNSNSFRNVPPNFSVLESQQVLASIKAQQTDLQQPRFAPVAADRAWSPPGSQGELTEEDRRKLAPVLDDIRKIEEDLAKQRAAAKGKGKSANDAAAQIPRLEERLRDRQKEQATILANAAKNVGVNRMGTGTTIWAHDITARAGMTYRYRVYVAVQNPLFHRTQLHPDQRKEFFNKLSLYSEPSPWSASVTIDQEMYYFMVAANSGNQSATVEVWRIFNGSWRPQEFVVQAGDAIGKVVNMNAGPAPFPVDYRLNALAVDVDLTAAKAGLNTTTARLLVLPGASDRIVARVMEDDRDDAVRARLRAEAAAASAPVAAGP